MNDQIVQCVASALQEKAKSFGVSSTISALLHDPVLAREFAIAAIAAHNRAQGLSPSAVVE